MRNNLTTVRAENFQPQQCGAALIRSLLTAALALAITFTLSCSNDGGGGGGGSGLSSGSNSGIDISSGSGGGTSKADCIREALGISAYTLNDIVDECGATKGEVLSLLPSTFGTCEAKDLDFDKTIRKIKEECGVDEIPAVSSSSSSKGNTGSSSSSSGGGSSSQKWYAYTYKNAALDNEITGEDDDGKPIYKIINASGNAELKIKSINQASWNDYAAATLALSKDKNLDLSKCSGFSYSYKGPNHRFTLESDDYKPIVFYNWNDESSGWTTATFTVASFKRDTYDSNGYTGSLRDLMNDKRVANFSWIVRAPENIGSGGAWNISGKTLEVADFKCIESGGNGTFTGDYGTFADDRDGNTYKWVKIHDEIWMTENLNYNASGSKCYNNINDYCNDYGRLYDWATAMAACPSGWRLPSEEEWYEGEDVLLYYPQYGGIYSGNAFKDVYKNGYWWSATQDGSNAWRLAMGDDYFMVDRNFRTKSNLNSVRCVKNDD
jgi:hypothetical protein